MNKSNKNINGRRQRSAVSKRLLMQYVASVIGYAVGMVVVILAAWNFFSKINWYPENPIYWMLRFVADYILIFAGITFLTGWVIITYYFISKPLLYLDEVVGATEQLIVPSAEPIILSKAMFYTESELNRVRERALDNARAAREAEKRKNDLIMYLAHDLKTPLSSVIGYLTLLRDEQQISDELRQRYLSVSVDKAERLEDLINEFFEIARFNLSNMILEYSTVNLTRMLEQIVYEFHPVLSEKCLNCELDAEPDLMVKCDANKMQRVFDNLLRNAVNYSSENTNIKVIAVQTDNKVNVTVINEGNTIPKEKLEKIFQQFYRLDTARNSGSGGAGLGLAIAKEIVEAHHGDITADSKDGTTCFKVSIPLS